jgi:hypothetical protein
MTRTNYWNRNLCVLVTNTAEENEKKDEQKKSFPKTNRRAVAQIASAFLHSGVKGHAEDLCYSHPFTEGGYKSNLCLF